MDAATLSPTFGAEAARLAVLRDWVLLRWVRGCWRHRAAGPARDVGAAADVALDHLAALRRGRRYPGTDLSAHPGGRPWTTSKA